jgi:chemotaxis protein MotB
MINRRRESDDRNHEAWAIPYADLLTLLLAFFVVLYAISAVDAGKFHALSDSMVAAFGNAGSGRPLEIGEVGYDASGIADAQARTLAPLDIYFGLADLPTGEIAPVRTDARVEAQAPTTPAANEALAAPQPDDRLSAIADIADRLETSLKDLICDDVIKVKREAYWLEIQINTQLLFPSGSATLAASARPVLADVADTLVGRPVRIHVEGHTDNVPIASETFPSNWELSSARAASVVHLFAREGVDPRRMVAMGYGEFAPIASNATAAGRAQNRRVTVMILPQPSDDGLDGNHAPERLRSDSRAPMEPR